MYAFLFLSAVVISVVHGFSLSRTNARSTVLTRTRMSDSYSDVSIVQSDDPKAALLSGVKSYSRAQMNEYVLQLEKVNPTFNPATSEVLNGAWEIVTTGIGAYGMIGFQVIKTISSFIPGSLVDVSDVTVSISGTLPSPLPLMSYHPFLTYIYGIHHIHISQLNLIHSSQILYQI